jgi:hypothetical protein
VRSLFHLTSRLHKLCQEASTDDPNSFNVPVCYNCLTRTVQKSIKSDIACAVQESNVCNVKDSASIYFLGLSNSYTSLKK